MCIYVIAGNKKKNERNTGRLVIAEKIQTEVMISKEYHKPGMNKTHTIIYSEQIGKYSVIAHLNLLHIRKYR